MSGLVFLLENPVILFLVAVFCIAGAGVIVIDLLRAILLGVYDHWRAWRFRRGLVKR